MLLLDKDSAALFSIYKRAVVKALVKTVHCIPAPHKAAMVPAYSGKNLLELILRKRLREADSKSSSSNVTCIYVWLALRNAVRSTNRTFLCTKHKPDHEASRTGRLAEAYLIKMLDARGMAQKTIRVGPSYSSSITRNQKEKPSPDLLQIHLIPSAPSVSLSIRFNSNMMQPLAHNPKTKIGLRRPTS